MKEVNKIIKKSNDLITAKYRLTIIQQYVLHNVISQIHMEDTDFKKYEVHVRSIAENHGIDTKNAYRYIKKSALDLKNVKKRTQAWAVTSETFPTTFQSLVQS